MITDKQNKEHLDKGFSQSILDQTMEFLKQNNGQLVNLAYLGDFEHRIIWRHLETKKVEAIILRFN
jgi:hypothetical protein